METKKNSILLLGLFALIFSPNYLSGQKVFGTGSTAIDISGTRYTDNNRFHALSDYQDINNIIEIIAVTGGSRIYINQSENYWSTINGNSTEEVIILEMSNENSGTNYIHAIVTGEGTDATGDYIDINQDLATTNPAPWWKVDMSTGSPTYVLSDKIQVIEVPNYGHNTTIKSDGILTCHEFDGYTGGIVCFKVNGTLKIEAGGVVNADYKNGYMIKGGDGGAHNAASSSSLFGHGLATNVYKNEHGLPARIFSSDDGFLLGNGSNGHHITALINTAACGYNAFDETSGKGGAGSAFPGALGDAGKTWIYYDPEYDKTKDIYRFGPGNGGAGGNGGNGAGSGGDGGGGSKGAYGVTSGSGTNGTRISPGNAGEGGDGGKGGGGIIVKAKSIEFVNFLGAQTVFTAKGSNGSSGENASTAGGNGGNGGSGANGNFTCVSDLSPQGVSGGPGKGGDGADAGDGGNGGDGGNLWVFTSTSGSIQWPPTVDELADISNLEGGDFGAEGTASSSAGTTGSYASEGTFPYSSFENCCPITGGGGSGGGGGGGEEETREFGYEWIEETQKKCDCKAAFELILNADNASFDDFEVEFTNSSYALPTTVANGERYMNSILDKENSELISTVYVVTRNHNPSSQSGVRLKINYKCQLNPFYSTNVNKAFDGIANEIDNGRDNFSISGNRVFFNSTNTSLSIGNFSTASLLFQGAYMNKFPDPANSYDFDNYGNFNAASCWYGRYDMSYGEPEPGHNGQPGNSGRDKEPDHFTEDDNSDEPNSLGQYPFSNNIAETQKEFNIYPNPANNELIVSGLVEEINFVELFNVSGKKESIQIIKFDNGVKLDLSNLVEGFYIVKLTTTNGSIIEKAIVKI
ncbi:MAG: T9SS type A sorting domain-containing protein [Bacteroidia bacterium]